jgi:hypothetical protein
VNEYLSALNSAAASALRAFGNSPTMPQKLVSTQRIAEVKAANSLVDAVERAFDKLAEWSLIEIEARWREDLKGSGGYSLCRTNDIF